MERERRESEKRVREWEWEDYVERQGHANQRRRSPTTSWLSSRASSSSSK
jgi:hypothetical protein